MLGVLEAIARVTYDMALALTRREHEITVFTTDKGLDELRNFEKNQSIKVDGIEAYYFKNLSNCLAKNYYAQNMEPTHQCLTCLKSEKLLKVLI